MARQPNTPVQVQGTGSTERLSSHRAVDGGLSDNAGDFERSVRKRDDWRAPMYRLGGTRKKRRH